MAAHSAAHSAACSAAWMDVTLAVLLAIASVVWTEGMMVAWSVSRWAGSTVDQMVER